jgi:hypothetical protein
MTKERVIAGKLRGVTTLVIVSAAVAYSLFVEQFFLGMVAAGIILFGRYYMSDLGTGIVFLGRYYMSEQTYENDYTAPEPDTETTTSADSNYSLVYGPIGTVQAAIPDGLEDYTAEWVLYATDRRFATVETERASEPPSHIKSLRDIADTLGYGKEVLPGNYAEPPEEVLHEVRRQVRKDIDSGKVRTDESHSPLSEDTKIRIGICDVEADEEEGGFRYSVSYDSRYFDWEADSTVETDGFSVSG